ncbi:DUF3034 family protein [Asticcacaulis solisilvae]|uniref:DUF3034 family protein n=1 Tax=Asticcacaulis solisilvae TaxID=1217274 RepID=UPI003FD88752
MKRLYSGAWMAALLLIAPVAVHAQSIPVTGGKLLLTGGVSQVEGSAGGGLTPWAVIGGNDSAGQFGGNAYATEIKTTDYKITSQGVLFSVDNRIELSASRQAFDTQAVGAALGLGYGYTINQTTLGAKVRLIGDAVLDQDRWLPQISAGVQYKSNDKAGLVTALGARSGKGTDLYLSATKLLLAHSLLLNATVRETKANQYGILGFGGIDDKYHTEFEASAAYLLSKRLAVGAEVRAKPDNLAVAHEGTAYDAFAAYAFNRHLSLTVAYVDLGNIVTRRQTGFYASLQAGF